jgi:hypothetical protein
MSFEVSYEYWSLSGNQDAGYQNIRRSGKKLQRNLNLIPWFLDTLYLVT